LIKSYGSFYPYYYLNSILYGSIPIDTIPDIGLNTQNEFIFDAISPGDINKDGYNDFLASVSLGFNRQGKLWVGGNPMPDLRQQFWGGNDNGYGELIGRVGDVNGDGIDDICVGQSGSQTICYTGFVQIFAGDTLFQQPNDVKDLNYLPQGFYLDNPYPNPFNPVVNIKYTISNRQFITIKVYDILGREISTLLNQEKEAGEYKITFNASEYYLPSGVYFIRMEAKGISNKIYSSAKKIVLTK
ncbi:MAG: T9SS type A sorting domain-containing protein, partial [Ignavibacteria bacterium]